MNFILMSLPQKPNLTPTRANPNPDVIIAREPDAKVFDEIYRRELLWRLPKVI